MTVNVNTDIEENIRKVDEAGQMAGASLQGDLERKGV